MPAFIIPLLSVLGNKWLWIGIAAAAALGYVAWLRHEVASARIEAESMHASVDLLLKTNEANAAELDRARKSEAEARKAMANVQALANRRAADLAAIRKKINATHDDSRCGPAVAAALDGLRARNAASGADPNSGAGATSRTDDMPR